MNGEQPTAFDKARDCLIHALASCDRRHLRDTLQRIEEAQNILETEEQFRAARRGST